MTRERTRAALAVALAAPFVWLAGVLGVAVIGRHPNAHNFDPEHYTWGFYPGAYWDSNWYLELAREGYDGAQDAAFFPLYPLLVRVVGTLTTSDLAAGLLVSLACIAGALILLHRLVAIDFGEDVALLTVVLVAVFPFANFFYAVYSESLFMLLSVGAIYAARTDRWALAGLVGALACATRSAGIVLIVPLFLLWWREEGRRVRDVAWLAAVPLGLLAFCGYLAATGEDALGPFNAQKAWGRSFAGPLGGIVDGADHAWKGAKVIFGDAPRITNGVYDTPSMDLSLFLGLLVTLAVLVGVVRRLPLAYSMYACAALAVPLSYPAEGMPLMSLPRFVAVLWPLHLWVALTVIERPALRKGAIVVSAIGLALVSARIATWRWVG